MCTPTVTDGITMRVQADQIAFRTKDNAAVHEVIVYDGGTRASEYMGLDLRGDHLNDRFEVLGNPEIGKYINIALGIGLL